MTPATPPGISGQSKVVMVLSQREGGGGTDLHELATDALSPPRSDAGDVGAAAAMSRLVVMALDVRWSCAEGCGGAV